MQRLARAVTIALAAALTQGGCYLGHAAWEQARILSARRPIAELVRDPSVSAATRARLELVLQARDFAARDLGLDAGQSFTAFTQLDRDTLVLVVSAAHADVLRPYTWWFPIVGRIPYKGYFDFAAARREATSLRQAGFDVYLRPADAYSTLGWFNDPLVSTTLARDSVELVNTVIHELTHNTFYAPGSADYNESFASFVGSRGAASFFRSYGMAEAAAQAELRWEDQKVLGRFWRSVGDQLDSAFARHPDDRAARLAARDTVYGAARERLRGEVVPQLRTVSAAYADRVPLNNAFLLAQLVYGSELELFDRLWRSEGHDLRRSIRVLIEIARSRPEDPFGALRDRVSRGESTSPGP
jgi:predicted aminopeptidase